MGTGGGVGAGQAGLPGTGRGGSPSLPLPAAVGEWLLGPQQRPQPTHCLSNL